MSAGYLSEPVGHTRTKLKQNENQNSLKMFTDTLWFGYTNADQCEYVYVSAFFWTK